MSREELVQEIIENLAKCQRSSNPSLWKESGLSHSQIGMLFMLSHYKKLQVKQIADYLGISKSAASQLLEPLTHKRLVSRQTDAGDRRIAHFSLSPEGIKLFRRIHKFKFAGLRSRLETLNAQELGQLADLSRKLVTAKTEQKELDVS